MGSISLIQSKRKRDKRSAKAGRAKKLAKTKLKGGPVRGAITDPELMTKDILKKRRNSPRANIELSGKKKRKLLKRLHHSKGGNTNKMEVEFQGLKKKSKAKSAKKDDKPVDQETADVEMAE